MIQISEESYKSTYNAVFKSNDAEYAFAMLKAICSGSNESVAEEFRARESATMQECRDFFKRHILQPENTTIRNIQDSVFTALFGDKKNIARFYNETIRQDGPYVEEKDIEIVTLKAILTNSLHNDLGFKIGEDTFYLTEAQSTYNPNMPYRFLLYGAATYKQAYPENTKIYGQAPLALYPMHCYMIYTGTDDLREKREVIEMPDGSLALKLSTMTEQRGDFEVTVHIIPWTNTDSIINEYIDFCKIHREERQTGYDSIETLASRIIERCLSRGILVEFLMSHRKEVYTIMVEL